MNKLFFRDFFLTLLWGVLLAVVGLAAQLLTDGDYRFHFIGNMLLFIVSGYFVKKWLHHIPLLIQLILLSIPYGIYYYTQLEATPLISLFLIFNTIGILLGNFLQKSSTANNKKILAISISVLLFGWFVIPTFSINDGKEITNQKFTAFEVTSIDGVKLKSTDLQGKIMIVSFWATWCVPCIAEMKELEKFYDQIKERDDIVIISINEDNGGDMEIARKFMDKKKYKLPTYVDSLGLAYKAFNAFSYPALYLVDSKGDIRWMSMAFNPSDDLTAKLLRKIKKIQSN